MSLTPSDPSQPHPVAGAFELRKAAAINEMLISTAPVLPTQAGQPILPFEIGIFSQFLARLRPDVPKVKLRRAIGAYASSRYYIQALAQPDAMRHDIDGVAHEPVSPHHRADAHQRTAKTEEARASGNLALTPAKSLSVRRSTDTG